MEDFKIFIPEVKGIGNQDLELAINRKLKKKAITWLSSIVTSEVKPDCKACICCPDRRNSLKIGLY